MDIKWINKPFFQISHMFQNFKHPRSIRSSAERYALSIFTRWPVNESSDCSHTRRIYIGLETRLKGEISFLGRNFPLSFCLEVTMQPRLGGILLSLREEADRSAHERMAWEILFCKRNLINRFKHFGVRVLEMVSDG